MARSLLRFGALAGVDVVVSSPAELALPEARPTPIEEAVQGAHALYTDSWVSLADDPAEADRKRTLLAPYRLDEALLAHAGDAIVMHCLPAHPGEEISEGLLYGERSAAWDQAENRLHAQKALLELLVGAK
jgi:ornithine carbamoyltransferase